jgi:hypothetical protein
MDQDGLTCWLQSATEVKQEQQARVAAKFLFHDAYSIPPQAKGQTS